MFFPEFEQNERARGLKTEHLFYMALLIISLNTYVIAKMTDAIFAALSQSAIGTVVCQLYSKHSMGITYVLGNYSAMESATGMYDPSFFREFNLL